MPDFGDEVGQMLTQKTEQSVQFIIQEVRTSRMFRGQAEQAADVKRANEGRTNTFDEALRNGKAGDLDFTDGMPQVEEFDLTSFDPETREVFAEYLRKSLEENGLDPTLLNDEQIEQIGQDGEKSMVPSGKYHYAYDDSQAEAMSHVVANYQNEAFCDPRVLEALNVDKLQGHIIGIENLTEDQFKQLNQKIVEATGAEIAPVRNAAGEITAGSVALPAEHAREASNRLRGVMRSFNDTLEHEGADLLKLEFSTETAMERGVEVNKKMKMADSIRQQMLANGATEAKVTVDKLGNIVTQSSVEQNPIVIDSIMSCMNSYSQQQFLKNLGANGLDAEAVPRWAATKERIDQAVQVEQSLASQFIDRVKTIASRVPGAPRG